ncbi:PP2C family protein-serine/threonine phosphatase [Oryzihumus leptocrescens]|uniref:Serine phosphatase RsbU (Regulator of sigma subunit) n=1 Tax=Oryzihumus leptocrescens TaxID=297536 RepID=A0A542ZIX0_9MICO|nr:GAF domain-containing SpoIIE family protein phosphatase [Oryzihumus leptocrescens]TQL60258.1 serine phosphatase RsbU (regulator of sigma subunit) [Oryzihumus leptocrescens]
MAQTFARAANPELEPRTPTPVRRLDLLVAVGTAAFAGLAYVVALFSRALPPPGLAFAFVVAAPLCSAFAMVILLRRSRAQHDPALGWVATGLGVGLLAMALQALAFPVVMPSGGPLTTSTPSASALYLTYHLTFAAGALLGILRAPPRWQPVVAGAGLTLALVFALDLVPFPVLTRPDGTYLPLLRVLLLVSAALVAVAAVLWVLRVGRAPEALRGWVGVALSLSVYDLVLNAVGGQRFAPVWWASLSLRFATYAVLAAGAVWNVLAQLRDIETYSDSELVRREGQLRRSLRLTHQLLSCAQDLARAVTPAEVGRVLAEDAVSASGAANAAVLVASRAGGLRVLGGTGSTRPRDGVDDATWVPSGPAMLAMEHGRPVLLGTRSEVEDSFPALTRELGQQTSSVAALPIRERDEPIGVLLLWGPEPHEWPRQQTDLLAGLAAQGGQAIARALAYEAQASAARTLQESLLPTRLPVRQDLTLAARYVPGESGLQVGGDWYDCVEVCDGLVALVVGDVMGKGLRAAALMGQMRTTLRSVTAVDPSPAVVLQALDRVTLDLDPDEIATMAYVLLDLGTGVARIARAGHLPPLLVDPDGRVTALEGGGSPPLGVPVEGRGEAEVRVPVGSLLVLYTDGVVESRKHGLDTLSDFVASVGVAALSHGHAPEPIAEELLQARLGKESDDLSLLLARYAVPVPTAPASPNGSRDAPPAGSSAAPLAGAAEEE